MQHKTSLHNILTALLWLISISSVWSQSHNKGLFFSNDLNAEALQQNCNINAITNDVVRGNVVEFKQNTRPYQIENNKRNKAISVAFWVCPKDITKRAGTIFGEDSVFYFRYLANRQIQFNHYLKKDIDTRSILTNNVWQHLAFTLNEKGKLQIFFNGSIVLTDSISPIWWEKKNRISIGQDPMGISASGRLDNLMIWNRAISHNEIKNVYYNSLLLPPLNHMLATYLPLKGSLNDASPLPKNITSQNIVFEKDPEKGMVARFSNDTSSINIDNIRFDNQMTMSLWIKPADNRPLLALMGNPNFTFRYLQKQKVIWFNVPMLYDCKSDRYPHNPDDWIHLAATVNYNHQILFFINGNPVGAQPAGPNTGTEGAITVGKSIWQNLFYGHMHEVAIWTRALHPLEIKDVYNGKLDLSIEKKPHPAAKILPYILLILLLLIVLMLFVRHNKRSDAPTTNNTKQTSKPLPTKNAIYILDKFRAYDKDGNNVSNEFTPTLIRIFSLIVLFPEVYNRRLTSHEMSDILWENDDTLQQKNSRSTNIHRLRKICTYFNTVKITYKNKEWILECSDNVFIDSVVVENKLNNNKPGFTFESVALCKQLQTHEFDKIRQHRIEKLVSVLSVSCQVLFEKKDWNTLMHHAKLWLSADSISEEALKYMVTSCLTTGKKQKALTHYNTFYKEYKLLFNESTTLLFDDCRL